MVAANSVDIAINFSIFRRRSSSAANTSRISRSVSARKARISLRIINSSSDAIADRIVLGKKAISNTEVLSKPLNKGKQAIRQYLCVTTQKLLGKNVPEAKAKDFF